MTVHSLYLPVPCLNGYKAAQAGLSSALLALPAHQLVLTLLNTSAEESLSSVLPHCYLHSAYSFDHICALSGGATLAEIWDRGTIATQDPLCAPLPSYPTSFVVWPKGLCALHR